MEMSAEQCARRLMAMQAGVAPEYIQRGQLSTWGERDLFTVAENYAGAPPLHVMTGDVKKRVSDIDLAIQERSPDIVYIDAGYLLQPDKQARNSSRWEAIANVAEELKGVAIRRNIPVVMTVQFNRNQRRGSTRKPELEDIGGADQIGQIASVIVGVRHGEGAEQTIRRRCNIIKNRDNREGEWTTRFEFPSTGSGMNFNEVSELSRAVGQQTMLDAR